MRTLLFITGLIVCTIAFHPLSHAATRNKKASADTVQQKKHSPQKATYLAILPGAGQIYNRKYWKLPIVYAGFVVTGYLGMSNRALYKQYGEAYTCSVQDPNCTNPLAKKYSGQDLITIRDYYRRNMELSFIIMGGWYVLQILDAMVDANFYNWDVSNNLSIAVQPVLQPPVVTKQHPFNGLKITVSF